MRGQGALEYLVLIALILGITSAVVLWVTGAFSGQKAAAELAACRNAAIECRKAHFLNPADPCPICDQMCIDAAGNDILSGTPGCGQGCQLCKQGQFQLIAVQNVTQCEGNSAPAAIIDDVTCYAGQSCTLSATSSFDPDGDNMTFFWTIEGEVYEGISVNHTFVTPGDYQINLTVTDTCGNTDSTSTVVSVGSPAPAMCTVDPCKSVPVNSCATTRPYYCNSEAQCVPACAICGCPSGKVCGPGGMYCVTPTVTVTKTPIGDAYVRQWIPDMNWNWDHELRVSIGFPGREVSYLKFNLSDIDPDKLIKAELILQDCSFRKEWLKISVASGPIDFDENTITWNTQPGYVHYITTVEPSSGIWKANITLDTLKMELRSSSSGMISFHLGVGGGGSVSTDQYMVCDSREGDHPPLLNLTLTG